MSNTYTSNWNPQSKLAEVKRDGEVIFKSFPTVTDADIWIEKYSAQYISAPDTIDINWYFYQDGPIVTDDGRDWQVHEITVTIFPNDERPQLEVKGLPVNNTRRQGRHSSIYVHRDSELGEAYIAAALARVK